MVPLKYLSNFSRTLEMPLINWTIKRTIKRIFKEQLIGINQSKISTERPNQYLDYLIDLSFQEVNRLLALSFEDEERRKSYQQLSSDCRNKKIWCYDWWTKPFWSTSKA